MLRNHLKRQATTFPQAEYVFVSSHETAIDPRNLLRRFKRALERAKLPATIRFHDLRHSCATFLIAQGEHPRVVMETLGHAQMSTTMDIYGHVLPSTQRAPATKLDESLSENMDQEALREVSADVEHRSAYPISISVGPVEFQHDQLIVMIAGLGRRSADTTASE